MNTKNKLPELLLVFLVIKICATTLGETGGDLLSMTLNIGSGPKFGALNPQGVPWSNAT